MSCHIPEFCGCIGPMYGEPHCSCMMKRLGLPISTEHKQAIAKAEAQLSKLFGPSGNYASTEKESK